MKSTEDFLRRAKGSEIGRDVRDMIKKIADGCDACKEYPPTPRRFKLTIGTKGLRFNHDVKVDTMFLQNRPVLHMVDMATHFCSSKFLRTQSTPDIWKSMLSKWMLMYAGQPGHLSVDRGSAFKSENEKMRKLSGLR